MLKFFIDQEHFFDKLDSKKYINYKFNLCWLINVFIFLINDWILITENEILTKALELDAYNENYWWKYIKLIKLLKYYWVNAKIFKIRFFHNYFLKKFLIKLKKGNIIFMASVNLNDENHLIMIENFDDNVIYYKSVWSKKIPSNEFWIMSYEKFKDIYNKRWIIINLKKNK